MMWLTLFLGWVVYANLVIYLSIPDDKGDDNG